MNVLKEILMVVSIATEIPCSELRSKKRNRRLVWARQIFNLIAYREQGFTLNQIGRFIDRDHSTVLHSLKNHDNLMGCKDLTYIRMYKNILYKMNKNGLVKTERGLEYMKLCIDEESVSIYIDNGENEDPISIAYWHIDEIEEDSSIVISVANTIRLFYTNPEKLFNSLKKEEVV